MDATCEATWAKRSLEFCRSGDLEILAAALDLLLAEMGAAGLDDSARADHPAVALLIARLADLSGLDFHWPKAAELRCQQLVARQRAAERCLPLAAA